MKRCAPKLLFLPILAIVLFLANQVIRSRVQAHPLSQGRLKLIIYSDRITMNARVNLEEVCLSNKLLVDEHDNYTNLGEPCRKHGEYLLRHIYLSADGKPLAGKVTSVTEPKNKAVHALDAQSEPVHYDFEYSFDPKAPPATIELEEDVLHDVLYSPGNYFECTYVTGIAQDGRAGQDGLLLTPTHPVTFTCDWTPLPGMGATAGVPGSGEGAGNRTAGQASNGTQPAPVIDRMRMIHEYTVHGIKHILGPEEPGYDHLLFVSALVLGALSFWDILKVVTAFTLAHTITLTLCVLDVVSISPRIVEPMIAASIVFVALQNVFWPKQSRGWSRLLAAFFFGLFHGLGFAGGLLENMKGIEGGAVILAIAAFSIGVELGHQAVVVPLFSALSITRKFQVNDDARAQISLAAQRYGSAVISIAGLFFLYAALFPGHHG